jgi:hypothetical protein
MIFAGKCVTQPNDPLQAVSLQRLVDALKNTEAKFSSAGSAVKEFKTHG